MAARHSVRMQFAAGKSLPRPHAQTKGTRKPRPPSFFVVFKWKCICSVAVNLVGAAPYNVTEQVHGNLKTPVKMYFHAISPHFATNAKTKRRAASNRLAARRSDYQRYLSLFRFMRTTGGSLPGVAADDGGVFQFIVVVFHRNLCPLRFCAAVVDGFQARAINKCILADLGHAAADRHACKAVAITERILVDLGHAVGDCHACKALAPIKCTLTDHGHTVGDRHARKAVAPAKFPALWGSCLVPPDYLFLFVSSGL